MSLPFNGKDPVMRHMRTLTPRSSLSSTGETEMTIDGKTFRGSTGDLFIVESGKVHGVSNSADQPCSYFAFKWR